MSAAKSDASQWLLVSKYAISLLFIFILVINVEWPKVWDSIRAVSVAWLLISQFSIPLSIVLIALRYRHLINRLISLRAMLHLVVVQAAIGTFLANAAGSISYIGILIKIYKVPAELAVQSTIIARLVEMFASVIVAAVLVAVAWNQLERIQSLVLFAMLFSAIVLVIAIVGIAVARRLKAPAPLDTRGTQEPEVTPSFWQRMLKFGVKVIRLEPGYVASILPKALLYSFIMQAVIAVTMYCYARAFHLEIGFFEVALVGIVSTFIASIPITVFGGLGVYEVSTVGLLAVFGVPVEASAGMILVVRTIFFVVMAVAFFVIRPPSQ